MDRWVRHEMRVSSSGSVERKSASSFERLEWDAGEGRPCGGCCENFVLSSCGVTGATMMKW